MMGSEGGIIFHSDIALFPGVAVWESDFNNSRGHFCIELFKGRCLYRYALIFARFQMAD